jgi:hypothetical protein
MTPTNPINLSQITSGLQTLHQISERCISTDSSCRLESLYRKLMPFKFMTSSQVTCEVVTDNIMQPCNFNKQANANAAPSMTDSGDQRSDNYNELREILAN